MRYVCEKVQFVLLQILLLAVSKPNPEIAYQQIDDACRNQAVQKIGTLAGPKGWYDTYFHHRDVLCPNAVVVGCFYLQTVSACGEIRIGGTAVC